MSLFSKLFQPAPTLRQLNAERDLRVADTLEFLISTGLYDGTYMCTAATRAADAGLITKQENAELHDVIENITGAYGTMIMVMRTRNSSDTYLRNIQLDSVKVALGINYRNVTARPVTPREHDHLFARRIEISREYWRLIRKLRKQLPFMHTA